MRRIWQKDKSYDIVRHYVDFCTRTSFSSLKIEGIENIPTSGAVMFAPNHRASLLDPLMILLLHRGAVGFAARADIFRNPKVAAILNWLRILPIARERDGRKELEGSHRTMDEIVECLSKEVPFCMFCEGTHRDQRGMMPVKKGIFRICRAAMDKSGKTVNIIPIGLDYEYFHRQMGRAAIRVGAPIDLKAFLDVHAEETDAVVYQLLCKELQGRIETLIDQIPERRKLWMPIRLALALLLLPLYAILAVAALPIWLPAKLILRGMEDKAWSHTVNYAVRFLLPIFWPFWWAFSLLDNSYASLLHDLSPQKYPID